MRKCTVLLALTLALSSNPLAVKSVPVVEYEQPSSREDQCLANVIYREARGEPLVGKRAVYDVVQQRMKATGKSACAVIFAPGQFQWTKRYRLKPLNDELKNMLTEVKNYRKVLNNEMFFHSKEVKPSWTRRMLCRKIFNHNFCAERSKPKEK